MTCRRRWTPPSPSVTSTPSNPGHHGTPEQREAAWNRGFEAGDPSACSKYLDPANLGDGSGTTQQDPGAGDPQQEDPGYPSDPEQQEPGAGDPQQQDPGYGDPQQQDPGYPSDDPGYGYEPYGVAAGSGQTRCRPARVGLIDARR